MKIKNNQMMSIFLMLMIGLSLQFNLQEVKEHKSLLNSDNLEYDDNNFDAYQQPSESQVNNNTQQREEENQGQSNSTQSTELYNLQTNWDTNGKLSINYLDRHVVNCTESNSALNSFKLETKEVPTKGLMKLKAKSLGQIRYNYTCVKSPAISNNCTLHQTPVQHTGFLVQQTLDSLVKHYVDCPSQSVMKSFRIKTQGQFWLGVKAFFRLSPKLRPKLYYEYTCCKAEISRDIFATTQKTKSNNRYTALSRQHINANDLNAISFFHMQSPRGGIFYELRLALLKGETSPSFPDYLNGESTMPAENQSNINNSNQTGNSQPPSFVGKELILFKNLNLKILELNSKTSKNKANNKVRAKAFMGVILYRTR